MRGGSKAVLTTGLLAVQLLACSGASRSDIDAVPVTPSRDQTGGRAAQAGGSGGAGGSETPPDPDAGGVGGNGQPAAGGAGGSPNDAAPPPKPDAGATDVAPPPVDTGPPSSVPAGCSDLFRQDKVQTYHIEISDAEWAKLMVEFKSVNRVLAGEEFTTFHPAVLRFDNETVPNVGIKLKGQSSWVEAATMDGDRAKIQFNVSFKEFVPGRKFHGLSKLSFDMPRSDWSFLNDRLSHNWLRQAGIMATCANSARVFINGKFYGVYVAEESVNAGVVRHFYPQNGAGNLWKGGYEAETNQMMPNWERLELFNNSKDITAVRAIVDIPGSVTTWAAEALLNNGDGIYGGSHNYYAYDQGAAGFVYLPQDTDNTLAWLALFDAAAATESHPIFWWEKRTPPIDEPLPHWMTVLNDPPSRARYVDAIAALLKKWDTAQLTGWIDTWSQQIAADVAMDPHTWATPAEFADAVRMTREVVTSRPLFLQKFVDCERSGAGVDADGDGVRWCQDCRDNNPAVRPGAAEVCGNKVDEDCDGLPDDGCK